MCQPLASHCANSNVIPITNFRELLASSALLSSSRHALRRYKKGDERCFSCLPDVRHRIKTTYERPPCVCVHYSVPPLPLTPDSGASPSTGVPPEPCLQTDGCKCEWRKGHQVCQNHKKEVALATTTLIHLQLSLNLALLLVECC